MALVPVESAPKTGGRVERLQLPRVEYAIAVHAGSLEHVDRTYAAARQRLSLAQRLSFGLSGELWLVQTGVFVNALGWGAVLRSRSSTCTTGAVSRSARRGWLLRR